MSDFFDGPAFSSSVSTDAIVSSNTLWYVGSVWVEVDRDNAPKNFKHLVQVMATSIPFGPRRRVFKKRIHFARCMDGLVEPDDHGPELCTFLLRAREHGLTELLRKSAGDESTGFECDVPFPP